MNSYRRYRDGRRCVLLAVPFFFLRASMSDPRELNALDRAVLRISAPIQYVSQPLARGVSNLWENYVYLVDVKATTSGSPTRTRASATGATPRAKRGREPPAQAAAPAARVVRGDLVSAQVIGKDITEFFRVASVVLDRGPRSAPEHAGHRAGRRGRHSAARRGRSRRRAARGRRAAASTSSTSAPTRAASCAAPATSRYSCQRREHGARRRGQGRRSAGHQRGRASVSRGHPGGSRHQGGEARLRHVPGGRSGPDRGLLAPRRGAHHHLAAERRARPDRRANR